MIWNPSHRLIFSSLQLVTLLLAPNLAALPDLAQHREFFVTYCQDCHEGDRPKGEFSIEDPSALTLDAWERVFQQLATREMPPTEKKKQPSPENREAIVSWLKQAMTVQGRTPSLPSGPLPQDGNLLPHEELFSGKHGGPASSPPRFWRRSQPQYDSLMEQLWVIPKLRYEKAHRREDPEWAAYSYSQPFPALDPKHFSNYSGELHADEATLRALLNAGGQIAERLTSDKPAYSKEHQPPIAYGIPSIRRGSKWERFQVNPPPRPPSFEPFLGAGAKPDPDQQEAALTQVFGLVLRRHPNKEERARYGTLLEQSIDKSGALAALRGLITAVIVSPEFVFRMELGLTDPDQHGRRMLSPRELVYALSFALSHDGPDQTLWVAAENGQLRTRADVEREVRRILTDQNIEKHRILGFFQEFFGYARALDVFKDQGGWKFEAQYLIRDADLLVEHILKKDRDVFAQLLTSDRYFVAYPRIKDEELLQEIIAQTIENTKQGIERTMQRGRKIGPSKDGKYNRQWAFVNGRNLIPRTVHNDRGSAEMSYIRIYGIDGNTFEWTRNQPITVPGRRAGLLTHPAWLVAHSTNFDNDVVGRGLWIREHLLAGKIPDVPIDVEAQVPEEPEHSLRHRMRVTRAERCVRCHQRMDPLGLPFESYDHYGHFREVERVGPRKRKTLPIDTTGAVIQSGEASLDGPVPNAIELVHKLAKSPRVRQSILRHAFRYWLGRNETLLDSPTLLAAEKAYLDHEGSFNEVLVSLLTSDSFLYRK